MGNWVQLTSGGGYDFENKVLFGRWFFERDLVHPLANLNRYAGHTIKPWAVAIHSVAVARAIQELTGDLDASAGGLLHDAHESVLGDIPTPVARAIGLEQVERVKQEIQLAIESDLGVPDRMLPAKHKSVVGMADLAALHIERQILLAPAQRDWGYIPPTPSWSQAMYDVMTNIIRRGEFRDGGHEAFMLEYERLITARDKA